MLNFYADLLGMCVCGIAPCHSGTGLLCVIQFLRFHSVRPLLPPEHWTRLLQAAPWSRMWPGSVLWEMKGERDPVCHTSHHTRGRKSSNSEQLRTLSQHPQGGRSGGLPKLEINSLRGAKPLRPGDCQHSRSRPVWTHRLPVPAHVIISSLAVRSLVRLLIQVLSLE